MRNRLRHIGIATALMVGLLVAGAAPAQARSTGLDVGVRSGAAGPVVVLTNRGAQPCRVATTTLGTVTAATVAQDRQPIAPLAAHVNLPQPLDYLLGSQLKVLEPGQSVELALSVIPTASGQAVETIAWSDTTGAAAWLYPVGQDGPVELTLTYHLPVAVPNGPPPCVAGTGSGSVTLAAVPHRIDIRVWLALALLAMVGIAALGVVLRRSRRRGRRASSVLVTILAVVALLPAVWSGPPAAADLIISPDVADMWAQCARTIRGPGGDPAGILSTLDDPNVVIGIRHWTRSGSQALHTVDTGVTDIVWSWELDSQVRIKGSGGALEPCPTIYHELFHAMEFSRGIDDSSWCVTRESGWSGIKITEVNATRAENLFRAKLGLAPRDHYGGRTLPSGRCLAPEEQQKGGIACGNHGCAFTTGDPHLMTFDRRPYSFMAVGEFVAARDRSGGFQVQVRQVPPQLLKSRVVSINSAVALDVAGDRVELRQSGSGMALFVGGVLRPLAATRLPAGGSIDATLSAVGQRVTVSWPDGSAVEASATTMAGIALTLSAADGRRGRLEGLLGNFDGDPKNDLEVRGGQVIAEPTFETLYPTYADSWRVDATASLFTYEPATGPDTYVDRTFPDRPPAVSELPNRAAAEAMCRAAGVTQQQVLQDCIFDVALTGQPDFVSAAVAGQSSIGTITVDGPAVTATVARPGATARFTFAGRAGQAVAVRAAQSTLPSECDVLRLLDATGRTLKNGCVIAGKGGIDAVSLPETAQYTVLLNPAGTGTGSVVIAVNSVTDQTAVIQANGPPVTATIGQPAATARFRFTAAAGQTVVVGVGSSTGLPTECNNLGLYDAAGKRLAQGCIVGGVGGIDAVRLPTAGEYRIVLDPTDDATGSAQLVLTSVTGRENPIEPNGPAVTAAVTVPGAAAMFTFSGQAGQRIAVAVSGSTMPPACGFPVLFDPGGKRVTSSSACVVAGSGGIDALALPVTGRYTLVFAPIAAGVGTAQVRLTM